MKHFDNIKDSLRSDKHLPEELSWKNMGPAIQERVDQLRNEDKISTLISYKYGFFLLASLFALVVITGVYLFNRTDQLNTEIQFPKSEQGTESEYKEEEKFNRTGAADLMLNVPQKYESGDYVSASPGIQVNRVSSGSLNEVSRKKTPGDKTTKARIDDSSGNEINNSLPEQGMNITESHLNQDKIIINSVSLDNEPKKPERRHLQLTSLNSLPGINYKLTHNSGVNISMDDYMTQAGIRTIKEASSGFSLSAELGMGLLLQNYGGSAPSLERNDNETGFVSQGYGIRADYKITPGFYISSGLQYQNWKSRFDYVFENQYTEERNNALVAVEINPFKEEPVNYYSDTLVTVTERRTIRHFNNITGISIPVILGIYKTKGQLDYTIGTGVSYTFNSKSSGRTIYKGKLLEFGTNESIYNTKLGLSVLAEAGIKWNFTSGLFIGTNLTYQKGLNNISLEEDIEYSVSSLNGKLVLGFNF